MAIPLEALTTFTYDGRVVHRGQRFAARSAQHAHVLTILKKAKPVSPRQSVQREAVPDPLAAPMVMEEAPRPKRQYRRRDLTAEPE